MKYTYLGHNVNIFEINEKIVITDPWIKGNPVVTAKIDAKNIDYIILTHGHFDHLGDTLELVKENSEIIVICNPEISYYLTKNGIPKENIMGQYIGGYVDYKHFKLKGTTAAHGSSLPDHSYGGLAMGFILKAQDKTVYISGDTGLTIEMKLLEYENIDVAIMPIGGRFTMDISDFIRALEFIKPKCAIPVHYNTFPAICVKKDEIEKGLSSSLVTIDIMEINENKII